MMIRYTLILFGTAAVFNAVCAIDEQNISIEEIYDMAQNVLNATEKWQDDLEHYSFEGRKSKFFPFGLLPFHALWGFGGLHALAILFAIKFKIIIVASIVAFSVYYYTKFIALKKCSSSLYREGTVHPTDTTYSGSTFFSSPLTGYSSPFASDIPGHSWDHISSFHDPSIHSDSSYTFDHEPHDHHDIDLDHHQFEHPPSNIGHYFSHQTSSHDNPSGGSESHRETSDSPPSMSPTYRRIGKHRRKRASKQQYDFIDIGELAFRFLGVNTEGCRKRFVCELDFRAKSNPITNLAFSFIGRNFFERYRIIDQNIAKPQSFADCAKIFNDCKDAERYNNVDAEEEAEETEGAEGAEKVEEAEEEKFDGIEQNKHGDNRNKTNEEHI